MTRQVPLVEQELITFPEHTSPPVFSGVCTAQSIVFGSVLLIIVCHICPFLLATVLSVPQFTTSDYSFGIFKLFRSQANETKY